LQAAAAEVALVAQVVELAACFNILLKVYLHRTTQSQSAVAVQAVHLQVPMLEARERQQHLQG
jgi:hypothetical protein